jgi:hypothetical protein
MNDAELKKRVRWVGAGSQRYLWFDTSHCGREDSYAMQEAFDRELKAQGTDGLRVLADFENVYHETALTQRWKALWKDHDHYVHRIACLGIVGSVRVVWAAYRFYVRLKGVDIDTKMRTFDNKEEALAWLLERA